MGDSTTAKPKSERTKSPPQRQGILFLVLALAFVLACRALLYLSVPDRSTDFDFLYDAAARLVRGDNPYPLDTGRVPYPLPAVLLAVPFTTIPLELARPVFDILVGWAFVYALWRDRGSYALLAVVSGAYLFAMAHGQTTPLVVAAILVPALGFLLAVRPNTAAPLWIARPSWITVLGAVVFVALSLAIRPSWPWDWWMALPPNPRELAPPLLRPFGFLLLLGALRWRLPEGRLILATAFAPQSTLPYELVPLALVPANRLEMALYVAGTWITVAAADRLLGPDMAEWAAKGWPVTLGAVYLPMLYLVIRRGQKRKTAPKIEKDRRRPNRLADEELKVDVSRNPSGGFTAKVTHLPTQQSDTESGPTREQAVRKAQDRLAAILAEMRSRKEA